MTRRADSRQVKLVSEVAAGNHSVWAARQLLAKDTTEVREEDLRFRKGIFFKNSDLTPHLRLILSAGDNANERQNQMIDDRLGRRLVQSLILCRTTYERFGSPKCDKFASAPHNPEYKKFAEELKSVFQSSSLQPYPFIVRSPDMSDDAFEKKKTSEMKKGDIMFAKFEKISTLGPLLSGRVLEACMQPGPKQDTALINQESLLRFSEASWQVWNLWSQEVFGSCMEDDYHPLGRISQKQLEREDALTAYRSTPRGHRIDAALEDGTRLLKAYSGYYCLALKASELEMKANVWSDFQSEHKDMGSARLYDPRWHPKVVKRAKACSGDQKNIDYLLFVARHSNLEKEKDKVETATRNLQVACEAIDQGSGYRKQLRGMLEASLGSEVVDPKPLVTDVARVKTRVLSTAEFLQLHEKEQKELDTYLTARFYGLPSVALHRGDQVRQKAFKLMEKVLKKYVLARRIDMRTDFQYVLLVMYHCPSRDQTFTREDLSDKQETKQTWFESLVSIVDTDEVPTEFLQDAFAQNLRRRIPCHFGDLRLSDFGRHVKKCRPISRQRYLVETADTLLPTWTRGIQAKAVGCFIIDAPMGLLGDTAWTLEQLVSVILQIKCTFTPPFTIVIYSLYGMGELQRALADQASPQRGGVQDTLQEGRLGPGSNMSTHMAHEGVLGDRRWCKGSGLIAAMRLGYNVAGFDIKEAQVNATKARIQKFSEQEDIAYKAYTAKKGLPESEFEPDDVNDGQSEDVLSPMDEELEALDNDTKEDDGFSDEFEDNVNDTP
ncbi:hypothetical protein WJX79_010792 [Trebouxia sp. C0005]